MAEGVLEDATSVTHSSDQTAGCPEHAKEELRLYCDTCGSLICLQCVVKGATHHKHDHELLEVAFEKCKRELGSSLEGIEKQLAVVEEALGDVDAQCQKISKQQASVATGMDGSPRTPLTNQLDQIAASKLGSLSTRRKELESSQAQLKSCLSMIRECLGAGSQRATLEMRARVVQKVGDLTHRDKTEPHAVEKILYCGPVNSIAVCELSEILLFECKSCKLGMG